MTLSQLPSYGCWAQRGQGHRAASGAPRRTPAAGDTGQPSPAPAASRSGCLAGLQHRATPGAGGRVSPPGAAEAAPGERRLLGAASAWQAAACCVRPGRAAATAAASAERRRRRRRGRSRSFRSRERGGSAGTRLCPPGACGGRGAGSAPAIAHPPAPPRPPPCPPAPCPTVPGCPRPAPSGAGHEPLQRSRAFPAALGPAARRCGAAPGSREVMPAVGHRWPLQPSAPGAGRRGETGPHAAPPPRGCLQRGWGLRRCSHGAALLTSRSRTGGAQG